MLYTCLCVCVCVCARACVRACVRARACVLCVGGGGGVEVVDACFHVCVCIFNKI